MTFFPQIVIGTYEEFVLGYNSQYENERGTKCKLHQSFATHSHQASVRCVAAHKHLMASSGADEYINIYDMFAMEVSTVINYHNSTVTCLEFTPDGSHLVTANQNGDIAVFRCMDWTLVKLWKEAHKHALGVTSISIHPSGSLLLTTGADNIVRFWNLVKGRQAYATNFSKKCSVGSCLNFGIWSKNGKFYAVGIGNTLEIYKTQTAALVYEIKANSRVTSSVFFKKNLICVSLEDGSVEIYSINMKKLMLKKKAHKSRTKSVTSFYLEICKNNKSVIKNYIVSTDSTGGIKLWYFKKKGLNCSLFLRGEADCGCRITCLTVVSSKKIKNEKIIPEPLTEDNITEETYTENQNEEVSIINSKKETDVKNKQKRKLKRKMDENGSGQLENMIVKKLKNVLSVNTGKQNSDKNGEKIKSLKKKKWNDLERKRKKIFAKEFKVV